MLKGKYDDGKSINGWMYQYAPLDTTQNHALQQQKVESDDELLDGDDADDMPLNLRGLR